MNVSGAPRRTPLIRLPALLKSAATAAVAAASAEASAIFLRAGLIDGQVAAVELVAVQRIDGPLGFRVASHFHKSEALGPACVPIRDDADTVYGSILFKQRTNCVFSGPKTEVSHKYIFRVNLP